MSKAGGSSDEAIGRPEEWREGRYQQPGRAVGGGVAQPEDGELASPEVESTPVTREDYEDLRPPPGGHPE